MNPATTKHPRAKAATLLAFAFAALLLAPGCATRGHQTSSPQAAAAQPSQHLRLGTYDSRAVAIAFGRSEAFSASIQALREQHAKAKADGNTQQVKALEEQGQQRQIRLHLQGFSNAPVDDALDAIRPQIEALARKRAVSAIVAAADYHDPSVELVDMTDDLVQLFNPTPQTLKIVKELRTQKPLPIEQVAQIPANE